MSGKRTQWCGDQGVCVSDNSWVKFKRLRNCIVLTQFNAQPKRMASTLVAKRWPLIYQDLKALIWFNSRTNLVETGLQDSFVGIRYP